MDEPSNTQDTPPVAPVQAVPSTEPQVPPTKPLTSPQLWMAVGAVACAGCFILIGMYRAGWIAPPHSKVVSEITQVTQVLPPPAPKVIPVAGCEIVGDSIAHGLASAPSLKDHCRENARDGIPAWSMPDMIVPDQALYIISAGSNQPTDARTAESLAAIRARVTNTGSKVIWVLPVNPSARAAAAAVASSHGDETVTFIPGKDRVHPGSYEALAKAILAKVALP